jgi:transcription elongation factor GreB
LEALWPARREVVAALSAAAAEGDRSENAEYIYRKKQLREMDRRIRYLQKRLDVVKPISAPPADCGRIFFGAWVQVEDESGQSSLYRIVGADEIDAELGFISIDSPVARALLGRAVGDEVEISVPEGDRLLSIISIRYSTPGS